MTFSIIITSKTGDYKYLLENFPPCDIVFASGTSDLIYDKNKAAKQAKGDILIFLDDDAFIPFPSTFFRHLEDEMLGYPYKSFADLVTTRVISPTNYDFDTLCSQDLGKHNRFFTRNDITLSMFFFYRLLRAAFAKFNLGMQLREYAPPPWGIGHGTCFAIRKTAFNRLGGFNSDCEVVKGIGDCEDIDLFYRLLMDSGIISYNSRMVIYHEHGRKTKEEALKKRKEYNLANRRFVNRVSETNSAMKVFKLCF